MTFKIFSKFLQDCNYGFDEHFFSAYKIFLVTFFKQKNNTHFPIHFPRLRREYCSRLWLSAFQFFEVFKVIDFSLFLICFNIYLNFMNLGLIIIVMMIYKYLFYFIFYLRWSGRKICFYKKERCVAFYLFFIFFVI